MTRPYYPHCREWRLSTLEPDPSGQLIIEVTTGSTPSTADLEFWGGPIPWLTPNELSADMTDRYIAITERTLTEKGLRHAGRLLPPRTVLLTKRAPVGYVVLNAVPMAVNQGFLCFHCGEGLCPEFLYYWLKGNKPYLDAVANGSTYPELYLSDLFEFEMSLPPAPEQEEIAAVLGSLDDKVGLNAGMNRTLEAMARAIFRSWFVDFDPVRAKMEGRKPSAMDDATTALFPDSFEDSELGPIPRGWSVGRLGDIADSIREGVRPDEAESGTPYIGLEHMPRKCMALCDWETADEVMSNKSRFRRNDILFGKLRPYFHKVGIAPVDGVCSTDILVIRPKEPNWYSYVLGTVCSEEFVSYTDAASTGTKMPRTNWRDMAAYQIVLPPAEVAQASHSVVNPMLDALVAQVHQSRILADVRDTLLPKLISGEIQVTHAERMIQEI